MAQAVGRYRLLVATNRSLHERFELREKQAVGDTPPNSNPSLFDVDKLLPSAVQTPATGDKNPEPQPLLKGGYTMDEIVGRSGRSYSGSL